MCLEMKLYSRTHGQWRFLGEIVLCWKSWLANMDSSIRPRWMKGLGYGPNSDLFVRKNKELIEVYVTLSFIPVLSKGNIRYYLKSLRNIGGRPWVGGGVGAGGGGTPGSNRWGWAAWFFKSWPYFRPKKFIFHTRFPTWPLRNYFIIT